MGSLEGVGEVSVNVINALYGCMKFPNNKFKI